MLQPDRSDTAQLLIANGNRHRAEARLREAEAHLWAMVVHFGGRYDNEYVDRDVAGAAAYVERHLKDEDMSARHRDLSLPTLASSREDRSE